MNKEQELRNLIAELVNELGGVELLRQTEPDLAKRLENIPDLLELEGRN